MVYHKVPVAAAVADNMIARRQQEISQKGPAGVARPRESLAGVPYWMRVRQ